MTESIRYLIKEGKAQFVDSGGVLHHIPTDEASLQSAWEEGWRPVAEEILNAGRKERELATVMAADRQSVPAGLLEPPTPSVPTLMPILPRGRPGLFQPAPELNRGLPLPENLPPEDIAARSESEALISEAIEAKKRPTAPPLTPEDRRLALIEAVGAAEAQPLIPGVPVMAFLEGGVRGATLGLSDWILGGILGEEMKAKLRFNRKYHPWATGIGEFAGIVAPGGLASDIGKGAKLAVGAIRGAKVAERTIQAESIAAKMAKGIEERLTTRGVDLYRAERIAKELASAREIDLIKAATKQGLGWKIAEAIPVGAAIGAEPQISAMALEEKPWSGKEILESAGIGAVINSGFTLIGSALGCIRTRGQRYLLNKAGLTNPAMRVAVENNQEIEKTFSTLMETLRTEGSEQSRSMVSDILINTKIFLKGGINRAKLESNLLNSMAGINEHQAYWLASNLGADAATLKRMDSFIRIGRHITGEYGESEKVVSRLLSDNAEEMLSYKRTVDSLQKSYASAFPSLGEFLYLPIGAGRLAIGGGLLISHNPISAAIVGIAPSILKKVIGMPYSKTSMTERILTEGWALLGKPTTFAGVDIMEHMNAQKLSEDMLKSPIDPENLKTNLVAGGWEPQQADSFVKLQTTREQGMIVALKQFLSGSAVEKEKARRLINALNDPRVALARLQMGLATQQDINVIKGIVKSSSPDAWAGMEKDAKELLEKAKTETVPQDAQRTARMVLNQGAGTELARRSAFTQIPSLGPGGPQYRKALKTAIADVDRIVSDMTPAQRIMRGVGK